MDNIDQSKLAVCICTYKRPELLGMLIADLSAQSIIPDHLIIVDGDPSSGEVKSILEERMNFTNCIYTPSNHPNLAYQRYLGWRAGTDIRPDYFLYLDDDIRILNQDAIAQLVNPMLLDQNVVGVSADTSGDTLGLSVKFPEMINSNHQSKLSKSLTKFFGSARGIPPGGLTPSGHRVSPIMPENSFAKVEWLQGRVMLYRMSAISNHCFSDDLFALDHIRCDLGEDTFLSRQIGTKGRLLLGYNLGVKHPNADLPKCYPVEGRKLGYATAYSRRFLNDHYRISAPPHLSDRIALFKSYLGNNIINFIIALSNSQDHRFPYAWGYLLGSVRGLIQKPTARNLTPEIDWWREAEEALAKAIVIQ